MKQSKRSSIFGVLVVLVLYLSLFLLGGKELQKISLEEILTIGSLDDDTLFQWVGVAADSQGCIYVTDTLDYKLKKFSPKGNLIKETRGRGQGPGEFLAPRFVDHSEKFLYVTDQIFPGIHVFDKDLKFVRRILLKMPVADFKVLSDDRIAVATLSVDKAGKIFIFDSKGNPIGEVKYSGRKQSLMMDLVSFDIDLQGSLYVAYTFQDKIEKFNGKGRKMWSRKLLRIKKVNTKKISSFVVPTEVVYKDVALDCMGNIFILGGHFSKNRSRDVYVLSSDGNHSATFVLPDTSHCIYLDSENFLYCRAKDGVELKKFRIRYTSPPSATGARGQHPCRPK